jgi:hypothetical protein
MIHSNFSALIPMPIHVPLRSTYDHYHYSRGPEPFQ